MVSWIPAASRPRKAGWKSASGERKLEEDQWVEWERRGGVDKPFIPNGDNLTIRKLVALLESRGLGSSLELLIEIKSDVAQLLFDITNDFTFGGGGEGITTLGEVLDKKIGQITTGKIDTEDSVGKSKTLVDGDSVSDAITRIKDDASGTTRSVERKDSLDGDVESRRVKGLEHDLGHFFTIRLWVEGSLCEEDRVFFRGDTEFVVKCVVPNFFHVVPVCDDAVFDGVFEGEDATLRLRFVTAKKR